MLWEVYTDQRKHDYNGPSRAVRHPRASSVGGGSFASSQDGTRCVVAGTDVLRILRITDPRSRVSLSASPSDTNGRVCTGLGGAKIEAGPNMWTASGLKVDSAPTDVIWARGTFDNKIVTSARNGEIIYWDLNRSGSKYETRIKEHKRAVNKLAISPFLPYLFASASQDGHLRIWDLRTPPASTMKVYHPTGIRALALSPVPSNPLTVCTGLESGNIQRWDLRNRALPLERITLAHSSSILSMDWQLPSMKETGLGWLLTSGMDCRVKIWNLCLSSASPLPANANDRDAMLLGRKMGPRAFRTLHTPFPVRKACWRPGYDCEVAIVSNNDSDADTVEIWDIRREWIAKWVLDDAEGGITDISFSSSHKIWAHHASGAFEQHDLRATSRPLDAVPRTALSWGVGALAFVVDGAPVGGVELPYDDVDPQKASLMHELRLRPKTTSDPVYVPHQQTIGVLDIPLFNRAAFARLARAYVMHGDKAAVCAVNAERAAEVGQWRAAETWRLLLSQLTEPSDPTSSASALPTHTPAEPHTPAQVQTASKTKSRVSSVSASSRGGVQPSSPMQRSPSSFYAHPRTHTNVHTQTSPHASRQDHLHTLPQSRHDTPSSSPSPRPRVIALPPPLLPMTTPLLPQPALSSPHTPSRRASTVHPVVPRAARPSLRRASMSTPSGVVARVGLGLGASLESPRLEGGVGGRGHTHSHTHVGEGALDDSDSDSESEGGSSGSGSDDDRDGEAGSGAKARSPSQAHVSPCTTLASIPASPAASRLTRGTRPLPSPLSQLMATRDDSPDGHLAGDERSVGEYDSDASDASHSPPSTPSSEESVPGSLALRNTYDQGHIQERTRGHESRTGKESASPKPSPTLTRTRPRGTSITLSHRSITKQESQSSIRTVTAPSEDRVSFHGEAIEDSQTGAGAEITTSETMSTRRPSLAGLALGLSNMCDGRGAKTSSVGPGHGAGFGQRMSEARIAEVREEEARLREIGWKALRKAVVWFADMGDVQMCALLAMVAPAELDVSPVRAARFLDAYIEMLSRLQLHTLAAHVRKYAPYESVGQTTQVQTTVYSSCGQCHKPFRVNTTGGPMLCQNCKALPTLCAICHLPARKLLVHCPGCGHGGHQACYRKFYLARPLVELNTLQSTHGPGDSYSTTETGSTTYYSLSDGSERDSRGEEAVDDDDDSEKDGSGERPREELLDYDMSSNMGERRARMRVLGHACAAGCGHWCWAANERFAGP